MANLLEEYALVVETSPTTGTGTFSLGGAVTGYRAVGDVLANTRTGIFKASMGSNWEIFKGTYASSGNTLARTQVYASTNGGSAVNWGSGDKTISLIKPGWSDLDDAGRAALLEVLMTGSEVTVASDTTCDILGAASPRVAISGTTTITSLGTGANKIRFVRATGAFTLTHNGTSLILPGSANIACAAGDTFTVVSDGSSNARVLAFQRGTGESLIAATTSVRGGSELATSAETITGADTGRVVTPAGGAAAWGITDSGTWTPAPTFGTPGDLALSAESYTAQYYVIKGVDGELLLLEFDMTFTPTFTTASGNFEIGGLPFSVAGGPRGAGTIRFHNASFSYPASRSWLSVFFVTTSQLSLFAHGSGQTASTLQASNMSSGSQHILQGSIIGRKV